MTEEIKIKTEKPKSKFRKFLNFVFGNFYFKAAAVLCAFLVWFAFKLAA